MTLPEQTERPKIGFSALKVPEWVAVVCEQREDAMVFACSGNTFEKGWAWWRWALGLAIVSACTGSLGWMFTGERFSTIYMVLLPWMVAVLFLVVSIVWSVMLFPFMMLVAKLSGKKDRNTIESSDPSKQPPSGLS